MTNRKRLPAHTNQSVSCVTMSPTCIKRTTLFKIPKEEDIPKALEAYKELERTAVKVSSMCQSLIEG